MHICMQADVYNVEREVHTLELLKLRFGEASLHGAGIMLKDVTDSKRLNTAIQQLPNTATPTKANKHRPLVDTQHLSATIVSHLFWPALQSDDIILPSQVCPRDTSEAHTQPNAPPSGTRHA